MENNENRLPDEDQLMEENRKWLEDLLKTPVSKESNADDPAQKLIKLSEETQRIAPIDDPDLQEARALVGDQMPVAEIGVLELEKILAEDWSSVPELEIPEQKEAVVATEEEILPEEEFLPAEEVVMEAVVTEEVVAEAEGDSQDQQHIPEQVEERKHRPKRPDGYGLFGIPHMLSTVIWLALIIAIGVSFGRVIWVCCADMMAFGKEPQTVTITITGDDTAESIAKKLSNASLIRYPKLFEQFLLLTGKDEDIGVGTFTLNSQLDYNAMVNAMYSSSGRREVVEIMFPEGYNCAQIFKLLDEKGVCSTAELEDYAANGELAEYWFLEGVARGSRYCLEGYMAPDTYKFYKGDTPRRVIEKFLTEFDSRFTDKMKEDFKAIQKQYADRLRAKGFTSAYIEEHTLTIHQVVTLASVIQEETSSDSECYDIASVFYNRLVNPNILSLGADATVYYAIGDYFGEVGELTAAHLATDSPYNTRKSKGIPPGPICNMGVQALYAALEPNETNYHYFVYDKNKRAHRFAVTEREHLENVKELMG